MAVENGDEVRGVELVALRPRFEVGGAAGRGEWGRGHAVGLTIVQGRPGAGSVAARSVLVGFHAGVVGSGDGLQRNGSGVAGAGGWRKSR